MAVAILAICAAISLTIGATLIHPAAGFLMAGACLLAAAVVAQRVLEARR